MDVCVVWAWLTPRLRGMIGDAQMSKIENMWQGGTVACHASFLSL
jgi:hypothetical protein